MSKASILITAYNRYENFKKLFKLIKFYKTKIYISIDGPKNAKDKIEQAKILKLIKSEKSNKINYRVLSKNLGCQKAVFSALNWFFLHEKTGIILEDDILPNKAFFNFCNKLLVKYDKNKKIFSISGYNPLNQNNIKEDYFYSKLFFSWGWATWKDRWFIAKKFIPNNRWKNNLKSKHWQSFLDDNLKKRYFFRIYKLILNNKIDSWAFLWLLFGVVNKSNFIIPKHNLVKNIGTQSYGANYVPSNFEYSNLKTKNFKLKNFPKKIIYNKKFDLRLFYYNFRPKSQLYPWRFIFLIRSLFLDPKFFFTKVSISFKKMFE